MGVTVGWGACRWKQDVIDSRWQSRCVARGGKMRVGCIVSVHSMSEKGRCYM